MNLKARLLEDKILIAPGVYDALTASIAEMTGFEAIYLSGAAVSYTKLGQPDIGLTSLSEMADVLKFINDKVNVPIIIDADTGFGNALNAQRTMRLFEQAGASALQIEDQTFPKRCGHLSGKSIISSVEMAGKVAAMADARISENTLIIARTDAIAVEGVSSAIDRANAYLAAGADVLFIEAPESSDQMALICKSFSNRAPLLANMVEGGKTPTMDATMLEEKGYSIAIFPGGVVRAIARTAQEYYQNLMQKGSTESFRNRMFDFNELNWFLNTNAVLEKGKIYESASTRERTSPEKI